MAYNGTVFIYIWHILGVFIYVIQNTMTYIGTVFISSKTTWHIPGHWLFVPPKDLTFCFSIMFFRTSILFARFCITPQHVLTGRCWTFTASCFSVRKRAVPGQQRCELERKSQHWRHSLRLWLQKLGKVCVFGNSGKQKQAQSVHEIFLYKEWNLRGQMYQVLDESNTVIVVTLQQAGGSVWLYMNQQGTVQSRGCLLGNMVLGSTQKCRVNAV